MKNTEESDKIKTEVELNGLIQIGRKCSMKLGVGEDQRSISYIEQRGRRGNEAAMSTGNFIPLMPELNLVNFISLQFCIILYTLCPCFFHP